MVSIPQVPRENFRATRAFLILLLTMVSLGVSAGMVQIMVQRYDPDTPIWEQMDELFGGQMVLVAFGIALFASIPASFYAVAVSLAFSHCRWSRRLPLALAFSSSVILAILLILVAIFVPFDLFDDSILPILLPVAIPCVLGAIGSTWAVWRFYKIVDR